MVEQLAGTLVGRLFIGNGLSEGTASTFEDTHVTALTETVGEVVEKHGTQAQYGSETTSCSPPRALRPQGTESSCQTRSAARRQSVPAALSACAGSRCLNPAYGSGNFLYLSLQALKGP